MFKQLAELTDILLDDDYGISYNAYMNILYGLETAAETDEDIDTITRIQNRVRSSEGRVYYNKS